MINVVGGVVVFTVSAVVPLVLSRAALSLMMSLMTPKRESDTVTLTPSRPDQPATAELSIAH